MWKFAPKKTDLLMDYPKGSTVSNSYPNTVLEK